MKIHRSKNQLIFQVFHLLLVLVCTITIASPIPAAAQSIPPGVRSKFDPQFLRQILQSPEEEDFRFLVTMKQQADLNTIDRRLPLADRRALVVEQLKTISQIGQDTLSPVLASLSMRGDIRQAQSFWIFNGMAVEGNRNALLTLAGQDDVLFLRPDRWLQWIDPEKTPDTGRTSDLDWGIERIRADQVWSNLNIDGDGVVVAAMDSGVDWRHPALQDAYRGWEHGAAFHYGNWFDATGEGAVYPVDNNGHGTHVMALMVGQDGIGAAPGA
ncbi:MAG: hypothetical protein JXA42_08875, partial [Anaerolineales bacterium]|nr:hypothetical protein [Anaerolineales bacterium]